MKYKIYELVKPEHLQKTEPDGYYMKHIERCVLEVPSHESGLTGEFETMNDANLVIVDNKYKNKGCEFCILPIVSVHWDGEIT